jgi:hypothetical protein
MNISERMLYKNGYKDGQNIILMSCGNAILAESYRQLCLVLL